MCALVTGVQTCALPIYVEHGRAPRIAASALDLVVVALLVGGAVVGLARLVAELPGGLVVVAHALLEFLDRAAQVLRSEEHPSELQSLMRISYAVFCLKKKQIRKAYIIHKALIIPQHNTQA